MTWLDSRDQLASGSSRETPSPKSSAVASTLRYPFDSSNAGTFALHCDDLRRHTPLVEKFFPVHIVKSTEDVCSDISEKSREGAERKRF